MKRLLSAMLAFSLLLALCGCGQFAYGSYTEPEPPVTTQPTDLAEPPTAVTEAPTEETTVPILTRGTVIAEKLPIFTGFWRSYYDLDFANANWCYL